MTKPLMLDSRGESTKLMVDDLMVYSRVDNTVTFVRKSGPIKWMLDESPRPREKVRVHTTPDADTFACMIAASHGLTFSMDVTASETIYRFHEKHQKKAAA